ncbi:MAG: hypothetical protein WB612_11680, partial [Nitrososphaeraceae archaeon]
MSTVKMDNPTLMKLPKLAAFLNSIERNSKSSRHAYFSGLIHLHNFIFSKYSNYNCETILEPLLKNKINIYELFEGFISYLVGDKSRDGSQIHFILCHCYK